MKAPEPDQPQASSNPEEPFEDASDDAVEIDPDPIEGAYCLELEIEEGER